MKARTTLLPSLFLIVTAHAAGADAIDDFATGAVVRVERATVDLGNGPRGSTGTGELRKRADSLDLTALARAVSLVSAAPRVDLFGIGASAA